MSTGKSRAFTAALGLALSAAMASCSTDQRVTEPTGTTSAALNSSPKIGAFLLYAERSINVGQFDLLSGGDLGVATPALSAFGSQLVVGDHAQVDATHNLLSPSVTLGSHAQVGDVQTTTLQNNGAKLGQVAPFPGSAMPPAPVVGFSGSTGSALTVASHQQAVLAPGSYGALNIADHANVTLTAGTYSFSSVSIADHVTITSDAAGVTVQIAGNLAIGGWDQIAPVASAGALRFLVAGADGSSGSPPAAGVGTHTQLTAILAAPHGTLSIADHAILSGAFAAFDVALSDHVQAAYQSGLPATSSSGQQGTQQLNGYITPPIAAAPLVGPVPPSTLIALSVSLPVQVPTSFPSLPEFVKQVSDPSNARYRQFLTPTQYATYYQPSQASYDALKAFLESYGLTVIRTVADNEIIDVYGTASQIEQMVFANLNVYARPDGSQFFAPDREPSLAFSTPVLSVAGLQNYSLPVSAAGSGTGPTNNDLWGNDFRNAYVAPCAAQFDGTGQAIGLIEYQNFNLSDIVSYAKAAGIPDPSPLIYTDTFTAPFSGTIPSNQNEAPVDIEVAHSMAPAAQIVVYIAFSGSISYGPFGGINFTDDMLHDMAHPPSGIPRSYQNSSSYFGGNSDDDTFQELAAIASMGGSMFQSSGDGGAFTGNTIDMRSFDNVTVVGGTNIVSFGGGNPPNEQGWNGSGGGFFGPIPLIQGVSIPDYQKSAVSNTNQASSSYRNFPDVSMAAQNIADIYSTQSGSVFPTDNPGSGTSASAPLWAGFMALANQAATAAGVQTVGFANPVLYGIGAPSSPLSTTCFNDITSGSNPPSNGSGAGAQDPASPAPSGGFTAGVGYDLVTGLGSPTCTLITQLASPTPLIPVPPATPTQPFLFAGVGPNNSCGIISGAAECWGTNAEGEVGNGTENQQLSPGCVSDLTGIAVGEIQVVAGDRHSCVLFNDGGVWCWGDNSLGQLGAATLTGGGGTVINGNSALTPIDVQSLDALDQGNPPTQLAAGGNVTCALLSDGSVYCWGQNNQGQLGNGTTNNGPNPTPTQVQPLPPASQVAVSTGGTFACALLQSGDVQCWGSNTYGQLGNPGAGSSSPTPVPVSQFGSVSQIAAGNTHVCAVVPKGQSGAGLWCWGDNTEDQLGEGDVNSGAVPMQQTSPALATQVSGCTSGCPPPVQVTAVACGDKFTCVEVAGGTAECWGDDTFGQLGNGAQSSTPVPSPVSVSALSNVTGIVAGTQGVCAQRNNSGISCWGAGPVGNGSSGSISTATAITFAKCP